MKNPATHYPYHISFRAVLLAVLAAASLVLAHSNWRAYKTARNEIIRSESEALQLAESLSASQQSVIEHTAHLLHALSGISLPVTNNPTDCDAFLARQLARFPEYDNLIFSDANGSPKCSAHAVQTALPASLGGFTPSAADKPLLLSLGRDYLLFALPQVSADGHVEGVVMASLPAAKFFRTRLAIHGAEFSVIDGSGRLVSAFPSTTDWVSADPLFDQAMLALTPGTVTPLQDRNRAEWLYVAAPVTGAAQGLRLLVRQPAGAVADRFMQTAAFTVAALAVAGLSLWSLLVQAAAHLTERVSTLIWKRYAPIKKSDTLLQ